MTFMHPEDNPLLAEPIMLVGRGLGVENALRGIAMDLARNRLENSGVQDFTDSSTGTAAADAAEIAIPAEAFDATSAGGATRTEFNSQMDTFESAMAVIGDHLNNVRARLGLKAISWASGTVTTAGTIPACTKTVNTTSGTTSLDYVEGVAAMAVARNSMATLVVAVNDIAAALGEPTLTENTLGTPDVSTFALAVVATAAAATTPGDSAVSKAAADTYLTALAANIATLAYKFNNMFHQTGLTDLTDNLSGTVSNTLAAMTLPVAFETVGTDCAPKAGFDTAIGVIANNVADLATRANLLLTRYNLPVITDGGLGAADTTLATHLVDLTEVTGTTVCVEDATGIARCTAIRDAVASLGAKCNLLAPYFGAVALTDSTGGTVSSAIGVIATATATGVSGAAGANASLEGTVVGAFLLAAKNAESSLAGKLAEFTGTDSGSGTFTKPLHVIAGY